MHKEISASTTEQVLNGALNAATAAPQGLNVALELIETHVVELSQLRRVALLRRCVVDRSLLLLTLSTKSTHGRERVEASLARSSCAALTTHHLHHLLHHLRVLHHLLRSRREGVCLILASLCSSTKDAGEWVCRLL